MNDMDHVLHTKWTFTGQNRAYALTLYTIDKTIWKIKFVFLAGTLYTPL